MTQVFFVATWVGWAHDQPGMMKNKRFKISAIVILCAFLMATLTISSQSRWMWISIPLHAVIETAGVFAALALAVLLPFSHTHHDPSYRITTAMGLSAMALLDLLHAAITPNDAFIWLHGVATALGGLFFMGVYFEGLRIDSRTRFALPILAGVAATITGLLIIHFATRLSPAFLGNQFASGTLIVNVFGGLMFLAAAQRFYSIHRNRPSPKRCFLH